MQEIRWASTIEDFESWCVDFMGSNIPCRYPPYLVKAAARAVPFAVYQTLGGTIFRRKMCFVVDHEIFQPNGKNHELVLRRKAKSSRQNAKNFVRLTSEEHITPKWSTVGLPLLRTTTSKPGGFSAHQTWGQLLLDSVSCDRTRITRKRFLTGRSTQMSEPYRGCSRRR